MTLDGLSLFFPCHNEEANIAGVIDSAMKIAPQVALRHEILVIDDGSTDHTSQIAEGYASASSVVRVIKHASCQGYGSALKSGFKAARYPWIFFSDGDDQFDLSELPRLVELSRQADIISGYRLDRADPWYRRINSRLYGLALRGLLGLDIPDINCAFKLYRREVFDQIPLKTSGALINAEIFSKALLRGYRISTVGVTHKPRRAGSPTGARWNVILKAMRELLQLWWDLRYGTL